ncbi:CHRD domain-containing protein [Caenimonas terrae]|uniref:CHRD domain-containing protein n=1 Tax=Caenimonas terrae TaxID=696074 RepID=A0ABW0N9M1_9BURK
MLNRHTFLRTALAAGLVTLTLAGCGQMRPSQKIQIFETTMSGSQEVPPNTSSGSGMAEVQFNENANRLTWKITYTGLTGPASAGHIHGPAPMGQNAGVVVPFPGDLNAQPVTGEATLTPAQYADLAAGLYYVNLHSARFPGGEIRGQLRRRM